MDGKGVKSYQSVDSYKLYPYPFEAITYIAYTTCRASKCGSNKNKIDRLASNFEKKIVKIKTVCLKIMPMTVKGTRVEQE